jgi:hypothetical protein
MADLLARPTLRHSHLMLRCASAALAAGDASSALHMVDQLRLHMARGQLDSSPVLAGAHGLAARAHLHLGQHSQAHVAAEEALSRWRAFDSQHPHIAPLQAVMQAVLEASNTPNRRS